jgi:hypothetical protein
MEYTEQERIDAREHFANKIEQFQLAAIRLQHAWEMLAREDHETPVVDYPFKESFDEVVANIAVWRDSLEFSK